MASPPAGLARLPVWEQKGVMRHDTAAVEERAVVESGWGVEVDDPTECLCVGWTDHQLEAAVLTESGGHYDGWMDWWTDGRTNDLM
jgi:hypothetical protein